MKSIVQLGRNWWRRRTQDWQAARWRRANVGPHSYIEPSVHVLGWQRVRIGHHTVVSADTWINVNHRDGTEPAVIIGDNCFISRRNFFSAGARISIGDYCLTGPDCHFLGADHHFPTPFAPYALTGVTSETVIEVGPNCWFGSSVVVLKNVRIGYGCVIGAGSVISHDVPPCSVVVGSPARILKRFDVRRQAWVAVPDYPADGDSLLPSAEQYLADLRTRNPGIKAPRAASGKTFGDL